MIFDKWSQGIERDTPFLFDALKSGNLRRVEEAVKTVEASDSEMDENIQPGNKYIYCAAKAVLSRSPLVLLEAWNKSMAPELVLRYEDLESVAKGRGWTFGSPQDALYTLVSDRAENWSHSLNQLGFKCAIMSAPKTATFLCADRFLLSEPDLVVVEMLGAITTDTLVGLDLLTFKVDEQPACYFLSAASKLDPSFIQKVQSISDKDDVAWRSLIGSVVAALPSGGYMYHQAKQASVHLSKKGGIMKVKKEISTPRLGALPEQEQVALKFLDQGLFLQKIFNGISFEAIGNNVKMISNPLRKNKIEIDAVYRASGRNMIVAVEAKNNTKVSKTQVYSIYETLRLIAPADWQVEVVVLLTHRDPNVSGDTNIDLIQVDFEEACFGDLAASIDALRARRTVRWKIKT
jgi:hypothetical protein